MMVARSAQWNPSVFRSGFDSILLSSFHICYIPLLCSLFMTYLLKPGNIVRQSYVQWMLFCRKEGLLPLEEVIRDYIQLAVDCDNNTSNTKYCVSQMLQSAMEEKDGRALLAAANMRQIW